MSALILAALALYGALRGVDVFAAMTEGIADGLRVLLRIFPAVAALLCAAYALRASGALGARTGLLAPIFRLLGIPVETAPLVLLRPISGSGALAVAGDIMARYGPDSLAGRTAAVMLGSTETTFYVIAVYFGAAGVKKTRWAIPAALCADFTGFVLSSLAARLL